MDIGLVGSVKGQIQDPSHQGRGQADGAGGDGVDVGEPQPEDFVQDGQHGRDIKLLLRSFRSLVDPHRPEMTDVADPVRGPRDGR